MDDLEEESDLWRRLNPIGNTVATAAANLNLAVRALSLREPNIDEARACIALAEKQIRAAKSALDLECPREPPAADVPARGAA